MEPPPFKLQVANGDIEAPTKTILLQFEIGVWNFKETFIVFLRLTGPIIGLTFLKSNSAILDVSKRLSFSLISRTHSPHMITPETENYTESIPTLPIRYPQKQHIRSPSIQWYHQTSIPQALSTQPSTIAADTHSL